MNTKLKKLVRIALIMLYSTFPMGLFASDSDSMVTNTCTHSGMAYAPYDDDCYFYIILDNGLYLKPELSSIPERLYPSGPFRVTVDYEVLDSISNSCGTGLLVYLNCIEMLGDSSSCYAMFRPERIRCDSLNIRCGDYTYRFDNESTPYAISCLWDFGDSTSSEEYEPVHEFPGPGVYDVCLTITASGGCTTQYCSQVTVGVVTNCSAYFYYYPTYNDCGDSINKCIGGTLMQFFDGSSENITSWMWDFGDGTTSDEQNPSHDFPGTGVYTVCLSVYSPDSCSDTYCADVYVGETPECHAYFEYCNYSTSIKRDTLPPDTIPVNYYLVGFKNLSEGITDYFWWDFGDGFYSTEENPIHSYQYPGQYNVCLSIGSYSGCSDVYCQTVNVGSSTCNVDFTYDVVFPDCFGYEPAYQFIPMFEGPVWSVFWDFGDGNSSYEESPAHTYMQTGLYDVCLEVYYQNNCYTSICKSVEVEEENQDSMWYEKCGPEQLPPNQENDYLSLINAYPNPANGQFNLQLNSPSAMNVRVDIISLLGQTQKMSKEFTLASGKNDLELNVSRLETGTYIYLIYSDVGVIHGRINIIR
jgi:PKD repeat protein